MGGKDSDFGWNIMTAGEELNPLSDGFFFPIHTDVVDIQTELFVDSLNIAQNFHSSEVLFQRFEQSGIFDSSLSW